MKLKKPIALFMAAIAIFGCLAGCGKGQTKSETVSKTDIQGTVDNGEIKNITWMYAQMSGMIPPDLTKVEAELNVITEEKIGVHVKLNPVAFSDYSNQISLVMASQEKVDVITTAGSNIWSMLLNQNQLTPMNDLITQYGSGIKEVVPADYFEGTTINGNLYAITTNGPKATTWGLQMRKDLIDKYNLKGELDKIKMVTSISDMNDDFAILENIFKTIKENEPEMEILFPWAVTAASYDNLSDGFGVLMRGDDKITNLYASEDYKKLCETMYDWAQKGYIMKDAATTTESAGSLLRSGRLFAYTINSGQDNYEGVNNGVEIYSVNLKAPTVDNSEILKFANCIPATSTEPEAAMKFLNLLYTDADVVNLMAHGIENAHYVKTGVEGHIDFPEGVDNNNTGYPGDQTYMYGNMWLTYFHETTSWMPFDKMKAFNDSATPVECLGFNYDPTNVKNEVAACSSVVKEFHDGLAKGSLNSETELPKFLEKLESSGINDIITEKQHQYDEWLKTKNAVE